MLIEGAPERVADIVSFHQDFVPRAMNHQVLHIPNMGRSMTMFAESNDVVALSADNADRACDFVEFLRLEQDIA